MQPSPVTSLKISALKNQNHIFHLFLSISTVVNAYTFIIVYIYMHAYYPIQSPLRLPNLVIYCI